jgi:hypothetical protein
VQARLSTTKVMTNAIKFLHAACFSPTTATWTQAISRGHFKSWPVPPPTRYKNSYPRVWRRRWGIWTSNRKISAAQKSTNVQKPPIVRDGSPPLAEVNLNHSGILVQSRRTQLHQKHTSRAKVTCHCTNWPNYGGRGNGQSNTINRTTNHVGICKHCGSIASGGKIVLRPDQTIPQ